MTTININNTYDYEARKNDDGKETWMPATSFNDIWDAVRDYWDSRSWD